MWHLNSRKLIKWMIFFTIIQLPLYFIFVPNRQRRRRRSRPRPQPREKPTPTTTLKSTPTQHPSPQVDLASEKRESSCHVTSLCPDEQQPLQIEDELPEAIEQLDKLRSFANNYNQFFLVNYTVTFVRAALVNLMNMGFFSDYHLADCFIMGRTILLGKTHRFTAIFATLFYIMYTVYRNYLGKYRPGFKFHAIEFLLHEYDEILAHEVLNSKSFGETTTTTSGRPSKPPGAMLTYRWSHTYESDHFATPRIVSTNGPLEFVNTSDAGGGGGSGDNVVRLSPFEAAPSFGCHRHRAISLGKESRGAQIASNLGSVTKTMRPHLDNLHLEWRNNQLRGSREFNFVQQEENWPSPSNNPLLYIRNSFITNETEQINMEHLNQLGDREPGDEYILRLNRTTKCWTILNRFALIASLLSLASFVQFIFLTLILVIGPLTTEFGFETSYPSCVRYLKRIQESVTNNSISLDLEELPYAQSIYLAANKSLGCNLRLDDLPLFYYPNKNYKLIDFTSFYHQIRIAFDLYESYLFNLGFICYLSAISFTIFILALDVVLNAREIIKRMVVIVEELRIWHESRELTYGANNHLLMVNQEDKQNKLTRHRSTTTTTTTTKTKQLRRNILTIQEILVDHFKLVGQYNSYVSLTLILTLTLLLCISLAFMAIIFTYKSSGIAVEYFVGEIGSIFLIIYLLTGAAATRATNVRLHSLISRAMALDCSQSVTKLRWAIIMKHYHPKPLYCFTLLEHTELSWLFCLKFASWSLSAVFVLAGFLYPR